MSLEQNLLAAIDGSYVVAGNVVYHDGKSHVTLARVTEGVLAITPEGTDALANAAAKPQKPAKAAKAAEAVKVAAPVNDGLDDLLN